MKSIGGLDSYEREKLETTKLQLQRMVDLIDITVKMLDFCKDKDIKIEERVNFDNLRAKDGLAGPESDISKLAAKVENAQLSILEYMNEDQVKEMEKELSLTFIANQKNESKEVNPKQSKGYNG